MTLYNLSLIHGSEPLMSRALLESWGAGVLVGWEVGGGCGGRGGGVVGVGVGGVGSRIFQNMTNMTKHYQHINRTSSYQVIQLG